MATIATIAATLVSAHVPTDVESDTNTAGVGTVNVQVPRTVPGQGGFIEFELAASVIAASVTPGAACTITISQ